MKKTLLLMAATALTAASASAASVKYTVSDLTESQITGEYTETTYKEDGSVQAYAHWQPLTKVVLGDYELTFPTPESGSAPALYTAKEGGIWTIRVYNGNSMTVTSTTGADLKTINLYTDTSKAFAGTASEGTVAFADNVASWTRPEHDAIISSVTFNFTGTFRISAIEFTDEAGVTPPEPIRATTVAELLNIENGSEFTFEGELTVAYANGPDCYVYDRTGATLLYSDRNDPWAAVLAPGTIISEFSGKRNDYNSTVEFIPVMNSLVTDGSTTVKAVACNTADAVNSASIDTYLQLVNVAFSVDADNERYGLAKFTDGTEATIYNRFVTASYDPQTPYPAAGQYDIYGLRSVYKDAVQVTFVKSANASVGIQTIDAEQGIYVAGNSIVAPADAQIYTINGLRSAAGGLAKGIYIVRSNGRTVKVVVK